MVHKVKLIGFNLENIENYAIVNGERTSLGFFQLVDKPTLRIVFRCNFYYGQAVGYDEYHAEETTQYWIR